MVCQKSYFGQILSENWRRFSFSHVWVMIQKSNIFQWKISYLPQKAVSMENIVSSSKRNDFVYSFKKATYFQTIFVFSSKNCVSNQSLIDNRLLIEQDSHVNSINFTAIKGCLPFICNNWICIKLHYHAQTSKHLNAQYFGENIQ